MPPINRIADYAEDMKQWRRWMHQHPELEFDCFKTAAYVAGRLREFGVDEMHEGIARTGIVAIIEGRAEGPTIGLRADMDALPMDEMSGVDYASTVPGKMHACGHDGHTTMLLGAARYLAETRNFAGRVALIFQPAEEEGGGAREMCAEGIMDRFKISQVYGIHNLPGLGEGVLQTVPGPMLAAVDDFEITLTGRGGHGAIPALAVDPVVAAVGLVQAMQTIVSRNVSAQEELVISVTQIHTGSANNVIPEVAWLNGTVRTFDPDVRIRAEQRLRQVLDGQAASYGVKAELVYNRGYPATVNDPGKVDFSAKVAEAVVGPDKVEANGTRDMGAEDFSYMLQERPGAYFYLGMGDRPPLHHPKYDFNDEVSPVGASFFVKLVETAQPL